ncbi:hypothetical protein EIN_023640 [Entamoeba invadens IP1]|uniref:hypothetical protein n=1 Tax=Entamoeba invadens IP1 TaxID=370355 RepID=UPI0002C3DA0D|nr:hypothetical protein EIN_023640 [Entamoeba invadens IP1]ELP90675.1 hypothetical protein EIN_023640 [Entamoeba invadens IP1]|eukprot:XP_004257446.1 hypothetical protein EIN_023640 [Entamoeba invadens IP1]
MRHNSSQLKEVVRKIQNSFNELEETINKMKQNIPQLESEVKQLSLDKARNDQYSIERLQMRFHELNEMLLYKKKLIAQKFFLMNPQLNIKVYDVSQLMYKPEKHVATPPPEIETHSINATQYQVVETNPLSVVSQPSCVILNHPPLTSLKLKNYIPLLVAKKLNFLKSLFGQNVQHCCDLSFPIQETFSLSSSSLLFIQTSCNNIFGISLQRKSIIPFIRPKKATFEELSEIQLGVINVTNDGIQSQVIDLLFKSMLGPHNENVIVKTFEPTEIFINPHCIFLSIYSFI